MPKPAKGTEFIKLLLSQASRDMREPLVPMAIPALAAHLSDVEFKYCDNKYYELCGQMGYLTGISGIGKAQIPYLIEANMRSFCDHDEMEYKKLADKERLSALRRERMPFYYVEGKNLYEEGIKNFPFYISRGEEGVE